MIQAEWREQVRSVSVTDEAYSKEVGYLLITNLLLPPTQIGWRPATRDRHFCLFQSETQPYLVAFGQKRHVHTLQHFFVLGRVLVGTISLLILSARDPSFNSMEGLDMTGCSSDHGAGLFIAQYA